MWTDTIEKVATEQLDLSLYLNRKRKRSDFYDKSPYAHRKIQKATWQHKNTNQNLDYTTIVDRLRTVSWSNGSYPTGVVKPVYGIPTLSLTAKALKSKGHTFWKFINNPPYKNREPRANQAETTPLTSNRTKLKTKLGCKIFPDDICPWVGLYLNLHKYLVPKVEMFSYLMHRSLATE